MDNSHKKLLRSGTTVWRFLRTQKRDPISIKKVACLGSSLAAVLLLTQSSCSRRLGAFLGDKQSEQSFRVRAT
jgi:hypothetical protein